MLPNLYVVIINVLCLTMIWFGPLEYYLFFIGVLCGLLPIHMYNYWKARKDLKQAMRELENRMVKFPSQGRGTKTDLGK